MRSLFGVVSRAGTVLVAIWKSADGNACGKDHFAAASARVCRRFVHLASAGDVRAGFSGSVAVLACRAGGDVLALCGT